MTSLILRIFSGKHYGAEIELTPGTWVIGSDDSCDIILSDSGLLRRHIALNIAENGATLKVEAANLDGEVLQFDEEAAPENNNLTALTPYRLGSVVFAWIISPAGSDDWKAVMDQLKTRKPTEPQEALPEVNAAPEAEADDSEEENQLQTEQATAPSAIDNSIENQNYKALDDAIRGQRPPRKRMYVAIVALAVVFTMIGIFSYRTYSVQPAPTVTPAQEITEFLAKAGFNSLTVTETAGKRLYIAGSVANDLERGQLLKLAESFPYPTEFSIQVDSDVAQALEAGFNAQNLWPAVSTEKTSEGNTLLVKGYLQNPQLESKAFKRACDNVPELQGAHAIEKIRRVIRYEGDLRSKFARALSTQELSQTRMSFLPGYVELELALTPAREAALTKALVDLRASLDVPVRIDVKNSNKLDTASHRYTSTTADQPNAGPSFRVVSTSMGTLKFITLASGEKVFEGGRLPGGYVLDNIHLDKLTLSKNNKRIIYPLKVRK